MADPTPPTPPSTPTGNSGSNTGPARSGTPSPAQGAIDAISDSVASANDLARIMERIEDAVTATKEMIGEQFKTYRSLTNELRGASDYVDSMEDSYKKMVDYQRKIRVDTANIKSFKELSDIFKGLDKSMTSMFNTGIFSKEQTSVVQSNLDIIKKTIKQLGEEAESSFNDNKLKKYVDTIKRLEVNLATSGRASKGGKIYGIKKDFMGLDKALSRVFKTPEVFAKHNELKSHAKTIKENLKNRVDKKTSLHEHRKNELLNDLVMGYTGPDNSDSKKAYIYAKAREKGHSHRYAKSLGYNIANSGKENVANRMALHILARGEGSMGRGIMSIGSNLLEGGVGALAEAGATASLIAAPFMILDGLIAENNKRNSEVATALGNSGLFSSFNNQVSAYQNLQNMRNNLQGPFFSSLGIGYEKNLAIAKSLQEAGLSNANLANERIGIDEHGFLKNSFGQMQQNVYAYGRLAGLDSSQTVAETIKLVTQYKESLASTHDFFIQISKAAATAGITTSKYIQVIDEVNSHYDRSNKLLESTVSIMRLLSVTGRHTAEDLTDAMSAITNGGNKRTIEQSAFLNQQILSTPSLSHLMLSEYKNEIQRAWTQVQQSIGQSINVKQWNAQLMQNPNKTISELLSIAQSNHPHDSLGYIAASNALEGLRSRAISYRNLRYAMNEGAAPGGVSLAFSQSLKGNDFLSNEMQNYEMNLVALKKSGLTMKDWLTNSPRMQSNGTYQLIVDQALGGNASKMNELSAFFTDAATARIEAILGSSSKQLNNPNSESHKIAEETINALIASGYKFEPFKGSRFDNLKAILGNKMQRSIIQGTLAESPMAAHDVFFNQALSNLIAQQKEKENKTAALNKSLDVAMATRSQADIMADAFTYLFNRIQNPLDLIAKLMTEITRWFHPFSNPAIASKSKIDEFRNKLYQPVSVNQVDKALQAYNDAINAAEQQMRNNPSGNNVALKQQIKILKDSRDDINNVAQAVTSPGQTSYLTQDQVNNALNAIKDYPIKLGMQGPNGVKTKYLVHDLHSTVYPYTPLGVSNKSANQFDQFMNGISLLNDSVGTFTNAGNGLQELAKDFRTAMNRAIINNYYNSANYLSSRNKPPSVRNSGEAAKSMREVK